PHTSVRSPANDVRRPGWAPPALPLGEEDRVARGHGHAAGDGVPAVGPDPGPRPRRERSEAVGAGRVHEHQAAGEAAGPDAAPEAPRRAAWEPQPAAAAAVA